MFLHKYHTAIEHYICNDLSTGPGSEESSWESFTLAFNLSPTYTLLILNFLAIYGKSHSLRLQYVPEWASLGKKCNGYNENRKKDLGGFHL